MITVDSTVSIDYIALGKIDNILKESLIDTAQALHTRVVQAQVLPFEYGTLQNESFFQDNTFAGEGYVMLVNATPYARRLYYHPEYTFWQGENMNAGRRWFEPWLPGGSEQDYVRKRFEAFVKRRMNT